MQTTVTASLTHDSVLNGIVSHLDQFSVLFNQLQRILYARVIKYYRNNKVNSLPQNIVTNWKSSFSDEFKINNRQYTSIYKDLFAKINSALANNDNYIVDSLSHIEDINKLIKSKQKTLDELHNKMKKKDYKFNHMDLVNQSSLKKKLFYKKNRLSQTQAKLNRLQKIKSLGIPHICFGSNKLFRQQFQIGKSNNKTQFTSHSDWYNKFYQERHKNFSFIGSHDETTGNSNCQITHIKGNIYELKVNVYPNAEKLKDKSITFRIKLHNDRNDYLFNAIQNNKNKDKSKTREQNHSQALTYRFSKDYDKNTYKIFISFDKSIQQPEITSYKLLGAIGIDINHDHLSMCEINHHCNYIYSKDYQLNLKDKTSEEATNSIGCAVKEIIVYAKEKSKPIIIEDLDFTQKKRELKDNYNVKYKEMLSSFAYNKIIELIKTRAFDEGVEVIEVNPAYTSKIGKFKYRNKYNLTTHQAASFVIARRGLLSYKKKVISKVELTKETNVIKLKIKTKEVMVLNREKAISILDKKHYPFELPVRNIQKNKHLYWKEMEKNSQKAKEIRDKLKRNKNKHKSQILGKQDLSRDLKPLVVDISQVDRSLNLLSQPF